jgi:hypothetical protein
MPSSTPTSMSGNDGIAFIPGDPAMTGGALMRAAG